MNSPNMSLCMYFQRGYCAFGNECRYVHARVSPQHSQPMYLPHHGYSSSPTLYHHHYHVPVRSYFSGGGRYVDHTNLHPSSSNYSRLFPTQRDQLMNTYMDPSKQTLVFDIDGTIADIEHRLSLAPGTKSDGTRTEREWNIVLDGSHYKHDRVLPVAWAYLKHIESLNKYNIVYLSGRRSGTLRDSVDWLFNVQQYPRGWVIHRYKGVSGQQFKQQQLIKLNEKYDIAGYFGDRIIDDCVCCIRANVRPILVVPNEWLFVKHIYGGLQSVVGDILADTEKQKQELAKQGQSVALQYLQTRQISDSFIGIMKDSKYWDMPYADLVPAEFATELFDDKNEKLLPPSVQLKCQRNKMYWTQLINESEKVLALHSKEQVKQLERGGDDKQIMIGDSNENKEDVDDAETETQAVRKFIETSEDENELEQKDTIGKTPQERKIQFHYQEQQQQKTSSTNFYKWVRVEKSVQQQQTMTLSTDKTVTNY